MTPEASNIDPTPGPAILRWPGTLLVAVVTTLATGTLQSLELAERRVELERRADGIAAAIAAEIESADDLVPETIARYERLTGSTIRGRGPGTTITSTGSIDGSRATTGVSIPSMPGWRVDVDLPMPAAGGLWVNAIVVGVFAGGISGLIGFRLRRDVRRLRRDLDILDRREASTAAGTTRRVSIPETPLVADAVRPLNELLAIITDRLEASEVDRRRQGLVIESMASGVLVLDRDGVIDSANPAARRLFGMNGAPVRGIPLCEAVRDAELHELVETAIRTGRPQRRVFRASESTPEQPVELATAVAPIVSRPDGAESPTIGGVVILVEDATYLRRLERARTDFVGNVSHELRTPITNLLGYIETTIELEDDDRETRLKFLEVAQRNARRLASIIEDLLSLASLEDSGGRLERDPIRLRPLLDRIADRHRSTAADRSVEVELDCEDSLETRGSATLLDQAIDNLVTNAIRYGRPGGRVGIEAVPEDSGVRISVTDEGPGIAPRHLPRLFERFYRVDTARSRQEGGTGLGLAIVKHIAAAHDGTVEATSTVGIGSCFTLRIPGSPPSTTADPDDRESTVLPLRDAGQAELTGFSKP